MARRRKKSTEQFTGEGPPSQSQFRENFETQDNFERPSRGIDISSNAARQGGEGGGILDLIEAMKALTASIHAGPSGAAAPTQITGAGAPQFGQNALGMASGFGASPVPPPPPAALVAGTAASRFTEAQSAGGNAPGLAGAMGMGPGAGASGVNFAAKAVGDFADRVGQKIGASGLEVSGSQIAKEQGSDPGRFVESALGTAAGMGVPGARGLQGVVQKLNADSDARSGLTALQNARSRLADIAGGLAQRGAHFTDSQLLQAREVLQQRAQRDIDVRMQIRNLEDGTGAQRSGLGSGGHAR